MKESQFWQLVKKNLSYKDEMWERIENTAGSGIPDVIVISDKLPAYFVELKLARGNQIAVRPTQVAWMLKACSKIQTFILVRKGDEIKLFLGQNVIEVARDGWNAENVYWTKKPFQWGMLKQVIIKNVLDYVPRL